MVQQRDNLADARRANSSVYRSLKGTKDTIRLLHASRNRHGNVKWYLEHYELGASRTRHYSALSYTWGNGALSKTIDLNDRKFRVPESVFAVIEAICYNSKLSRGDSWWWIDSICINQNDRRERASQVRLMERIYHHSHRTIGWLGKGSGSMDQIEDYAFTSRGDKAIKSLHALHCYYYNMKRISNEQRAFEEISSLVNWKAVEELLLRPWWTKVWTLQEYLVPKTFIFWCDHRHISRELLNETIYAIYKLTPRLVQGNTLSAKSCFPVWTRRRLCQWYQERGSNLPLVALISYGCESKATDPKDRIYSVLGLAKGDHDKDLVEPNYKKAYNASDAYIAFFKAFVRRYASLDIVCFVEIFNQRGQSSKSVSRIPSWVPDWTAEVTSCAMPVMASQASNSWIGNFRPLRKIYGHKGLQGYEASGRHSPRYTVSKDNKVLKCRGTIVDVVQSIAGARNKSRFGTVLSRKMASVILDEISRTLLLGRADRYLNRPASPGQFYNDFRGLCQAADRKPEDVPDLFFRWFRFHQDLIIKGHSLKEICKRSLERPAFASDYPPTD